MPGSRGGSGVGGACASRGLRRLCGSARRQGPRRGSRGARGVPGALGGSGVGGACAPRGLGRMCGGACSKFLTRRAPGVPAPVGRSLRARMAPGPPGRSGGADDFAEPGITPRSRRGGLRGAEAGSEESFALAVPERGARGMPGRGRPSGSAHPRREPRAALRTSSAEDRAPRRDWKAWAAVCDGGRLSSFWVCFKARNWPRFRKISDGCVYLGSKLLQKWLN